MYKSLITNDFYVIFKHENNALNTRVAPANYLWILIIEIQIKTTRYFNITN